eukprot:9803459-Ditylum_brightwellii.AAC.1
MAEPPTPPLPINANYSVWEHYTNMLSQRLGALYKYTKKALGIAIQIHQESAWEHYKNTPPPLICMQPTHNKESTNGMIQIKPSQRLSV